LSRERAEKEQQRLAKKEQELQELEAKLTQDILMENQNLNMQLADSLNNYLKVFNADGRYHIILSNTAKDNVLMAAEQYDITAQVIEGMNARCKK
jgi:outer membrane protein